MILKDKELWYIVLGIVAVAIFSATGINVEPEILATVGGVIAAAIAGEAWKQGKEPIVVEIDEDQLVMYVSAILETLGVPITIVDDDNHPPA